MRTLNDFWSTKKKLPDKVEGLSTDCVNHINKQLVLSNAPKNSKRGQYNKAPPAEVKYAISKYASIHGVAKTLRVARWAEYDLKEATVRGWKKKYDAKQKVTKRMPKNAVEAGLIEKKRGRRSCLGEEHKKGVLKFLKGIRESGSDVNRWTTAIIIKSYLDFHKCGFMLQENGGWIDPNSKALRQELWDKVNFVSRKKCSKRRGPKKGKPHFTAAQYRLRVLLMKRKYKVHDALEMNFDETFAPITPQSEYTMAEKGSKSVEGDAVDDKRGITAFLGGARTGEGSGIQLIYTGTLTLFFRTAVIKNRLLYRQNYCV